MSLRRVLGVALVGLLFAGCGTAASTTTKTISVDAGTLVIQPAQAQPVIYGRQAAVFDLEHSETLGSGFSIKRIEFGYVTIDPRVYRGAVPAPRHALSWAIFYDRGVFASAGPTQSGPVTCPGGRTPAQSVDGVDLMIVSSVNEASFLYKGAGTDSCGQSVKPFAVRAYQKVSVPWVDLGGDRIRAFYPGCVAMDLGATLEGVKSAHSELHIRVLGSRTIGPCAKAPTTSVLVLDYFPNLVRDYPRPWLHDPTGPQHG